MQAAAVRSGRLVDLLRTSSQGEGSGFPVASRRRTRRSVFLHSGVRICPQESVDEVLSNHQAYYQLRGRTTSRRPHVTRRQEVRFLHLLPVEQLLSQSLRSQIFLSVCLVGFDTDVAGVKGC